MTRLRRLLPRFSILNLLMAMMIVALAITASGLYREVGPLRAENKQLNEERGTLVIDDPARMCAIKIPGRFAGANRDAFRVYVPPNQQYTAYVRINHIPKDGFPPIDALPSHAGILGSFKKTLFARLEPGENTVVLMTRERGDRRDIVLIQAFDVSANTPADEWPSVTPETYSVFGGGVQRERTYADASDRLVLLRRRIQAAARSRIYMSYVPPEPAGELDGVMMWLERTK